MPAWVDEYIHNGAVFSRHNRRRIEFLRSTLSEKRRDVFDLIPLLLHEECIGISAMEVCGCPVSGISNFTFTPRLQELVKQYFPGFVIPRKAKNTLPIIFLALMGSAGTISFTQESDLDFWVGIETQKNVADFVPLLREKLNAIEAWARECADFEVHFFLTDLRRIRAEDYGELDKESCGSALGKLLKDEFYRTAIVVQGRIPFYWIFPVGTTDVQYRDGILRLHTCAVFPGENYVDLGIVNRINPSEYFGAAIWQLLKGLRSPFKSVLKMALIDRYTHDGAAAVPLCEACKQALFAADGREHVDPYLFMIKNLRQFYRDLDMTAECQLIEECFLVRSLLYAGGSQDQSQRGEFFRALAREWGRSDQDVQDFENFRCWECARIEAFNRRVINYFLETYKRIRSRTREAGSRMSDRDMTVVGKKLQSFFGKTDGKVPYEFSLYSAKDLAAIDLRVTTTADREQWDVCLRVKGVREANQYQIVRRVDNPLIACAWVMLNRFFHERLSIQVRGRSKFTSREAAHLIRSLESFFPDDTPDSLKIDDLLAEKLITHLYLIPNWNAQDVHGKLVSLFVFYRTSIGELHFEYCAKADCRQWLFDRILVESIGRWRLRQVCWQVHLFREVITPARRVGEVLRRQVEEYILQVR